MKGTEGNSFAISANFVFSEDNFSDAKFVDDPYTKEFIWGTLTSQSIKEKPL